MKELNYWYLREGDFLPSHIREYNRGNLLLRSQLEELKEAGNLFLTKEEATRASEKVRDFLCSINNPWCL